MSHRDIGREIEDFICLQRFHSPPSAPRLPIKVIPEQSSGSSARWSILRLAGRHSLYKVRGVMVATEQAAVHTVLALNLEGKKEVLGLYPHQKGEGANFLVIRTE